MVCHLGKSDLKKNSTSMMYIFFSDYRVIDIIRVTPIIKSNVFFIQKTLKLFLTRVSMTHSKTIKQIFKLANSSKVMTKTHNMASPRFLQSSNPMTSSVSQAA